jgi:hypothetical protein
MSEIVDSGSLQVLEVSTFFLSHKVDRAALAPKVSYFDSFQLYLGEGPQVEAEGTLPVTKTTLS